MLVGSIKSLKNFQIYSDKIATLSKSTLLINFSWSLFLNWWKSRIAKRNMQDWLKKVYERYPYPETDCLSYSCGWIVFKSLKFQHTLSFINTWHVLKMHGHCHFEVPQIIFHNCVVFFFQEHDARMKHWDILILLSYHRCQGNRCLLILLSEMKVKTDRERKNKEPARQNKNLCSYRDLEMFLCFWWDCNFESKSKLIESF